jgi:hypothetical protein
LSTRFQSEVEQNVDDKSFKKWTPGVFPKHFGWGSNAKFLKMFVCKGSQTAAGTAWF